MKLHHVGVRVRDAAAARAFYVGVLGLRPHPEKDNWLGWDASTYPVHLMSGTDLSADGRDHKDLARHFAIEVGSLKEIARTLLAHGLRPFQSGFGLKERREVTEDDDLEFGIGTVFVADPDGNVVEFIQAGHGLYGRLL